MTTTKLQHLTKTKKKIEFTVPEDKVNELRKKAQNKIQQSATLKGFRPGKIPTEILEKNYGSQIDFECLNFIVQDTYPKALDEHKLVLIMEPKFETKPLQKNSDYHYAVELEVKPPFELKPYTDLKIKKKEMHITEEDLEQELKQLQNSLAQLEPVPDNSVLTNGLVATIDFEGSVGGKSFKGGSAKDYTFEFGAGHLLQEFEEKISGMKRKEERRIEITFPKDYFEKNLADKTALYKIALKSLHKKILPKLDDELAKDIGKKDLAQVKDELKQSLTKRKEHEHHRDYVEQVKKQLITLHEVHVPETLVEKELKRSQKSREEVTNNIKLDLILEKVAIKENIKASPQDVQQRFTLLSQVYKKPVREIQKFYTDNNLVGGLITQIAFEKTLDFLVQKASAE